MLSAGLALVLALVNPAQTSAGEDWRGAVNTGDTVMFVNRNSVRSQLPVRTAQILYVYEQPDRAGSRFDDAQVEFDCSGRRSRILRLDRIDIQGRISGSAGAGAWRPIRPGSARDDLRRWICGDEEWPVSLRSTRSEAMSYGLEVLADYRSDQVRTSPLEDWRGGWYAGDAIAFADRNSVQDRGLFKRVTTLLVYRSLASGGTRYTVMRSEFDCVNRKKAPIREEDFSDDGTSHGASSNPRHEWLDVPVGTFADEYFKLVCLGEPWDRGLATSRDGAVRVAMDLFSRQTN